MKGKLFYAEASKGYVIKVLVDVLGPLQRGKFTFTKDGITLRQCDENTTIMFDVFLDRKNLKNYHCSRSFTISMNLKHLQKMLKNVKKKDSITLSIDKNHNNQFLFAIKPEEIKRTSRVETNNIVFQEEEHTEIDLPEGGYNYPMVINASEFQKIKRLTTIGQKINIKMQGSNYLSFRSGTGEVFGSQLEFGEPLEEGDDEGEDEGSEERTIYEKEFHNNTVNLLVKLPGLCSQMNFYAPTIDGFPLKLEVAACQNSTPMGTIRVFIKDIAQIDYEESVKSADEDAQVTTTKTKTRRSKRSK